MGLKGKLIGEVEVKSHGHRIHDFFAQTPDHVTKASPSLVQGCQLNGSVISWNYTVDGKEYVATAVIQKSEEPEKVVAFKFVEGDLLKEYCSYTASLYATEEKVKWVLEYERANEDVPPPIKLFDFTLTLNNHVDHYVMNKP